MQRHNYFLNFDMFKLFTKISMWNRPPKELFRVIFHLSLQLTQDYFVRSISIRTWKKICSQLTIYLRNLKILKKIYYFELANQLMISFHLRGWNTFRNKNCLKFFKNSSFRYEDCLCFFPEFTSNYKRYQ